MQFLCETWTAYQYAQLHPIYSVNLKIETHHVPGVIGKCPNTPKQQTQLLGRLQL